MPEYIQSNLPFPDQDSGQLPPTGPALSPSEAFRLANPELVEPARVEREWNPNIRRSGQLEGVGGGLRAGVDGELQTVTPVRINKVTPVKVTRSPKRRVYESRHGDSERGFGTPDYFEEPVFLTDEEKRIGKLALQQIQVEQAERAKSKPKEV